MIGKCSGHGRCGPRGECICYPGYSGERCDVRECEEGLSSATCETCQANAFSESCDTSCSLLGCSSAGRCTPSGECECYEGFTGADCSRRVCDDGHSGTDCGACQAGRFGQGCDDACDLIGACSGHGKCTGLGGCECYAGYVGSACERDESVCAEGLFSENCTEACSLLGACSGHGRCLGSGACECHAGFNGSACQDSTAAAPEVCGEGLFSDRCQTACSLLGTCSGHGRCAPSGSCECYPGYAGASCDRHECEEGYGSPSCEVCTGGTFSGTCDMGCTLLESGGRGCSSHGRCRGDGTCECYEGYSGASCEVMLWCEDAASSGVGCRACAEGRFGASCNETCSLLGSGALVFRALLLR